MKTKLLFDGSEFLKQQNLPHIFLNKMLLAPGNWNDNKYTSEEIKKAYLNTDWKNKSNFSLYLDHRDTQEQGVGNWVGYVKNIKLEKGAIKGDLEVWNPSLIIYLKEAKAKFGISATLKGFENKENNKMQDFKFESFSVVTNPACKNAFINLSEKSKPNERRLKIITMAEDEVQETEPVESTEEETEVTPAVESAEVPAEEPKELAVKKKKEKLKKKKEKEPEEEKDEDENELSKEELSKIYLEMDDKELSAYTKFVKEYIGKNEGASVAEAAKAWKKSNKSNSELGQLSDVELLNEISQRYEILKKRKEEPEDEEDEKEKLSKLSQEVKLLREKLSEPAARKTLNAPAPASTGITNSDPVVGMAEFIKSGGQGVFGIKE